MRLITPEQLDANQDSLAVRFVRHAADKINNVTTRMALLEFGAYQFPVSINDGGECADNSYVVSPLTAFTGYADYELAHLGRPWLAWPCNGWSLGWAGIWNVSALTALCRLTTGCYRPMCTRRNGRAMNWRP